MINADYFYTDVGRITLYEQDGFIIKLCLYEQNNPMPCDFKINRTETIKKTTDWLYRYFRGKNPPINELPLLPSGNEFRLRVWELIKEIPYGETATYGELAKKTAKLLGKEKMSAQAIGNAVGHNPIPIIIPCHRVIGKNGNLTGYTPGLDIKYALLAREGVDMTKLHYPKRRKSND